MKLDTIHVDVNQDNIDKGRHSTCCSCPVAISIYRLLSDGERISEASVHPDEGHFTIEKMVETTIPSKIEGSPPLVQFNQREVHRFKPPKEAQEFVKKWDAKEEVAPFSFDIEPQFWARNTGNATVPTRLDAEVVA